MFSTDSWIKKRKLPVLHHFCLDLFTNVFAPIFFISRTTRRTKLVLSHRLFFFLHVPHNLSSAIKQIQRDRWSLCHLRFSVSDTIIYQKAYSAREGKNTVLVDRNCNGHLVCGNYIIISPVLPRVLLFTIITDHAGNSFVA